MNIYLKKILSSFQFSHLKIETIFIRTVLTLFNSPIPACSHSSQLLREERQVIFIATLIQQSYFSYVKTKTEFECNCSGTVCDCCIGLVICLKYEPSNGNDFNAFGI